MTCYVQSPETVIGEISRKIKLSEDGKETIEFVIELEDKIFILDFSDKTDFDQTMKSLPYPKKNGFYINPEGEKCVGVLQLENGDMIYFRDGKKYEVVGKLNNSEKVQLFLSPESKSKKCFLLFVKKIKMLNK
jgi:hypothetical protein